MHGGGWHAWQGVMCVAGGMNGRGACVAGGIHGRGVCVAGGMCCRRHVWGVHGRGCNLEGGMRDRGHTWQGACMGVCMGGMHGRGGMCVYMAGGALHTHPPPRQILQDTVTRSMSGRYASYWNAFLLSYLNT